MLTPTLQLAHKFNHPLDNFIYVLSFFLIKKKQKIKKKICFHALFVSYSFAIWAFHALTQSPGQWLFVPSHKFTPLLARIFFISLSFTIPIALVLLGRCDFHYLNIFLVTEKIIHKLETIYKKHKDV